MRHPNQAPPAGPAHLQATLTTARAASHPAPGGSRTHATRTRSRRPSTLLLTTVLLVGIGISAVISLGLGAEPVPLSQVRDVIVAHLSGDNVADSTADTIVWHIRLPRVLLAILVGAGLSIAGVAMQTLVRNPLADPYLLGISAGAGVGATLVIMFGALAWLGIWALSVGALAGALAATFLVFGISMAQGGLTPLRLILTGVVMAAAFSSISSFLVFFSEDRDAVRSVMFWMLGSVAGTQWGHLVPSLIAVSVCAALLWALHSWLDALAAGSDFAAAVGVPVPKLRTGVFVISSLLVGVLVAVSGGIGFVGLIIPHAARLLVGSRHRAVLPVAAMAGALFLLWVDVASRLLVSPAELPLGVMTGLIGAPVFLFLLGRHNYQFSGGN